MSYLTSRGQERVKKKFENELLFIAGGQPVDANQEMMALGLINLAGSFIHSMPTTGSFR
jgi:hypothetical protein